MALRGTLGDFGIADIFQLVGHQTKTGVLLLKNRELEVRIFFVEGNVVKAVQSSRDKRDLLGNIMVRAGVLSEAQLEEALNTQQRTLRRLGDILVESRYVDRKTLREFTRLQTTETIYRLFQWKVGTYEFSQQDIDYDEESYEPIRAETILMEGFRMVDEWPAVRRVIPNDQATFSVLKPLPEHKGEAQDDDEDLLAGLDDAFREMEEGKSPSDDDDDDIGQNERIVFALVEPGRTLEEITDRSRLGEFETTKALANLVREKYLQVHVEEVVSERPRLTPRALFDAAVPVVTRVALYAVVAAAFGGVVKLLEMNEDGLFAKDRALRVRPGQLERQLGELQLLRIERALEVHRLLQGSYPETLDELAESQLLVGQDLAFPYRSPPSYRRTAEGYHLAPPLR